MKERAIGLLLLLLGCGGVYIGVILPINEAEQKSPNISTFMKATIIAPVLIGMGLLHLVMGEKITGLIGTREKPKPTVYAIVTLLALVGLGGYVMLRQHLQNQGYQFRGF